MTTHPLLLAAALALAALGVLMVSIALYRIIRDWGKPYVHFRSYGPTRHAIITSRGRGSATLVLHEGLGRVYEVETNFRGERPQTTFVPPAIELVRSHVTNRILELHRSAR